MSVCATQATHVGISNGVSHGHERSLPRNAASKITGPRAKTALMNPQIHKGNYVVIGIVLTDYDGNVDTTTAIVVSAPSGLLVEPVASGASNRSFYVSVPPAATTSGSSLVVSLSATIAATGTGVGAPPVTKGVTFTFDTVVPVDHRAAAIAPGTPSAESPLPHP